MARFCLFRPDRPCGGRAKMWDWDGQTATRSTPTTMSSLDWDEPSRGVTSILNENSLGHHLNKEWKYLKFAMMINKPETFCKNDSTSKSDY
ncbi:MAG: hypothetical protein QXH80_00440 [Candidatus Nanoarchaeia archaeon]